MMFRLSIGRVLLGLVGVWAVIAVIVVFLSVGSGPTTSQPTPPPASRLTVTPEVVSFPFSWVEEDIEITVVEVMNLGTKTDVSGNIRRVIEVPVVFRNLAHEHRDTGVVTPAVAVSLALNTDRGNVYEGLAYFYISDFDPEEVKETQARFEIRPDEQPVELWEYEVVNAGEPISQQAITRIWKLG